MERRKWLTWAVGDVADKIYDNIEHSECTSDRQCYFISGSFSWSSTKEGHKYWSSVHSKIQTYLNEKIDPQLTSFLKKKGLWDKFIDNFNPQCKQDSYTLNNSFIWSDTKEGDNFWNKVYYEYFDYYFNDYYQHQYDKLSSLINSSLTNKSDYENQLQGEEDPRREGDGSERSGICCQGNEPRFRLGYTIHRERVDFQKREVRDFKVHLSTRHPVLL